jgi:hypothetical protein
LDARALRRTRWRIFTGTTASTRKRREGGHSRGADRQRQLFPGGHDGPRPNDENGPLQQYFSRPSEQAEDVKARR